MNKILTVTAVTLLIVALILIAITNKKSTEQHDRMVEAINTEACLVLDSSYMSYKFDDDSLMIVPFSLESVAVLAQLKYIFVHCTATPPKAAAKLDSARLMDIFSNRGWDRSGYQFFVTTEGKLYQMRPFNWDDKISYDEIAYGVKGYNSVSIHISYAGGVDENLKPKDTRTPQQKQALSNAIRLIKRKYPFAQVLPHNAVSNKACPSFDVYSEFTH